MELSASRIAAALNITSQAVRKRLRGVQGRKTFVKGQKTQSWPWKEVPSPLQDQLNAVARQRNYRDARAMFSLETSEPYKAPTPIGELSQDAVDYARKLQQVLCGILDDGRTLSPKQRDELGVAAYQRVFGQAITPRYLRKLLERVRNRDGGRQDWNNLELYLPERPARKKPPHTKKPTNIAQRELFDQLTDLIAGCLDPGEPSPAEREEMWRAVFDCRKRMIRGGVPPNIAGRQVRDTLWLAAHARHPSPKRRGSSAALAAGGAPPLLAQTRDALRKQFDYKLLLYERGELRDHRVESGGSHDGYVFPQPGIAGVLVTDGAVPGRDRPCITTQEDADYLTWEAIYTHGGRINEAWRASVSTARFSPTTLGKYRRSRDIPRSIYEKVAPLVRFGEILLHGKRALNDARGKCRRSYDGVPSLFCMQADDLTPPVYAYVPDGEGWYRLVRGQALVAICVRTRAILGFSLQPDSNYDSLTIRSLFTRIMAEWGLPKLWYLERGVWEHSTLITGKKPPFGFTEITGGLRDFGIEFMHAITPQAKIIEGVFEHLQRRKERERGYCGRNEREDAPEAFLRAKQAVERGAKTRVHPSKYFYSFEQWNKRLREIVDEYNSTPQQDGRQLNGLTPFEGLERFQDWDNPPMRLDARLRYLLAHEKIEIPSVRLTGITHRIGKNTFRYGGSELAPFVGRPAVGWFDPENPEILTVTDRDRNPRTAVCVPRTQDVPILEKFTHPGGNIRGQEMERWESMMSPFKARITAMKCTFRRPERPTIAPDDVVELGATIERQTEDIRKRQRATHRNQELAARAFRDFGIAPGPNANPTDENLRIMEEFERRVGCGKDGQPGSNED